MPSDRPPPDRDRLALLLRRLGVDAPDEWVENADGEPEVAAALFLHEVRQRLTDLYRRDLGVAVAGVPASGGDEANGAPPETVADEGDAAAHRLLAAGADPADLARVSRGAAAATASTFVAMLDRVLPPLADASEDEAAPGWALAETSGDEQGNELTGRYLADLHEILNALYESDGE